jgi:RecA-family ATPase
MPGADWADPGMPSPLAASDAEWGAKRRAEAAASAAAASGRPQVNGLDHAAEPLAPINPAMLAGRPVPPRQWLVPEWVPMARATGLYGSGGEGKTRLAQQLATAGAIGAHWLGLSARRCNSLLVYCEDDFDEMHRRQEEINQHYGCGFANLGAMRWLPRLGGDNALMSFDAGRALLSAFFNEVLRVALEHRAQLIVVDTLADVFSGNENDRGQARAFVQAALGYLARETQGAVIALAHPSRTGVNSGSGESGSTAWIGAFRSQLYLSSPKADGEEHPDPDARLLTRKKSNAARRDETIELRWHDGVFIRTGPPTRTLGSIERRNCEAVFLDLLDKVNAEGQPVSSNTKSGNYVARLFARRPDQDRFKRADFERAMQTLFVAGEIRNEPYGGKGDERFRIVRARGCADHK